MRWSAGNHAVIDTTVTCEKVNHRSWREEEAARARARPGGKSLPVVFQKAGRKPQGSSEVIRRERQGEVLREDAILLCKRSHHRLGHRLTMLSVPVFLE